jgi:hypothetical protein
MEMFDLSKIVGIVKYILLTSLCVISNSKYCIMP